MSGALRRSVPSTALPRKPEAPVRRTFLPASRSRTLWPAAVAVVTSLLTAPILGQGSWPSGQSAGALGAQRQRRSRAIQSEPGGGFLAGLGLPVHSSALGRGAPPGALEATAERRSGTGLIGVS